MIDSKSSSAQNHHHQQQDPRSTSSASLLPPRPLHSNRNSIDSINSFVNDNTNNLSHSHPPPVKARSPLSNLGDQIVKAARRLSMTSSPKENKDSSYNPPPSPSFLLRSGTTSPDLHRKRNSTLEELQQATSPSNNNNKSKESKVKAKDKKPLVKIDLFNLRSKSSSNNNNNNNRNSSDNNNSSQVNLTVGTLEKSLPGSSPPPSPPSKETFRKSMGMFDRQVISTEDDLRHVPQQNSIVPAPSSYPIPVAFPAPASRLALREAVSQEQHKQEQQQKQDHQQQQQGRRQGEGGHTDTDNLMYDREHAYSVKHHPAKSLQFFDSALPLPSTSPLPSAQSRNLVDQTNLHGILQLPPLPPPPPQQQKQIAGFTSATGADLSQSSISNDLQDSSSSIGSDHSLVMEDVFEFYDNPSANDSSNNTSRQSSMRNDSTRNTATTAASTQQRREPSEDWTIDRYHRQQQQQQQQSLGAPEQYQRPPAPEPSDKKPLSALERIKRQQKRHSQEQERLAELVLPQELMVPPSTGVAGYAGSGENYVLPVREVPRDLVPIRPFHPLATASQVSPLPIFQNHHQQQHQHQQTRDGGERGSGKAPIDPGAAIIGTDSVMLDQLLTLIPGPNRPRLPSQVEWQQGIEELRQRRKDAATLTNSVGRQNSSGSRHSQDSSTDGRSRRHSMPDMPHGQSRVDQERRTGDNFRNPMLMTSSSNSPSSSAAVNLNTQLRRSGFEDREQQLLQPPIQRQSIAETQSIDVSMISSMALADSKRVTRKRAGKRTSALDSLQGQEPPLANPSDTMDDKVDKDVVNIAFSEMLATFSLLPTTISQLESLPTNRKWAMLQSNDASPSLPQAIPPQIFVDLLLEYSNKKKRSSRDQFAFNLAAMTATATAADSTPKRPMGMWKNFSATDVTSSSNTVSAPSDTTGLIPPLQPTFQQHLSSLLGKSDKRALEEREQVLRKLRVLIRNGSVRWTSEFINIGGPLAILQFCQHVQRTEETKLGQRRRLLHQIIQCIKAIVTLDGGVASLTTEPIFFSLMRTLAIQEAPVLSATSQDFAQGSKAKTGGIFGIGGGGAFEVRGQRYRSSSIPKPLPHSRVGHQPPYQTSPALSLDQIPSFSNTQAAVHILNAILLREPDLRDKVLKDTVADRISTLTQRRNGEGTAWVYSEWIGYLKEVMHICGIKAPVAPLPTTLPSLGYGNDGNNHDRARKSGSPPRVTSMAAGIVSQGCGSSGSSLSVFSLENIRSRRRHSAAATPQASQSTPNVATDGIRFESGEDREVLTYLTAHLELVSRLVFEMHVSSPGLAFAKCIKQELEDYLELLRSTFIQNHDLRAQAEELKIQLSVIPSTTQTMANLLAKDLPAIPPIDPQWHSQHSRDQQGRQQLQQFPAPGPTSTVFQRPKSSHMYQFSQRSPVFQHLPVPNAKCNSESDPKTLTIDIPGRSSSLEDNNHHHCNNKSSSFSSTNDRTSKDQRTTNNGATRIDSKVQQRVLQFQQQRQPSQRYDIHGDNGKALVMQDGELSPMQVSPSNRRISFRSEVPDGDRCSNSGNYSSLPPSQPQQQHHRQNLAGRVSSQIAFREDAISNTSAPRRPAPRSASSTSVPPTPTSPIPDLQLPDIPSKNKNRPTSMDAKGRRHDATGAREGKVIISLDHPRQRQQEPKSRLLQYPPLSPSVIPLSPSRANQEPSQNPSVAKENVREGFQELVNGADARKDSSSISGYSQRLSLDSQVYPHISAHGKSRGITESATMAPVSSQLLAAPLRRAGLAMPGVGQARPEVLSHGVNNVSIDGSVMSTCSSTTSSGFSATSTSSTSSASPPTTQTKKRLHSSTTKSFPISPPQHQTLEIPSTTIVQPTAAPVFSAPACLPESSTPIPPNRESRHRSGADSITTKEVRQFRNVDFDNQIQEGVRKLASSSSTPSVFVVHSGNNKNKDDGRSKGDSATAGFATEVVGRYSVQATDPKVLEAPIIVPEDMSLMREQYIQAQISEVVVPPMVRKA
ncbi:hypothetical protein K457DRAFT_21241 [Linnemannia elongata AG-77]|uniref:Formin GTPase-binding domain-containing protein n=1 Tax=Linnemannia elongata AG-77 TaxID=1314771 RepID=A0A197JSC4_9FUNG|nr:hypothetical protein K457DRAFT_21241 [Linnemannia elongata AG-77]